MNGISRYIIQFAMENDNQYIIYGVISKFLYLDMVMFQFALSPLRDPGGWDYTSFGIRLTVLDLHADPA